MIQVWGRTNSSNVMKVLWLLDELGLAFARIDAGLAFGRTDTAEYRAINPYGLVPVLRDGDVALFESNTILRYLCTVHAPATTLYPVDPGKRARVEAWMDAQLSTLAPFGTVFQQLIRLPPERRDQAVLASALERSRAAFGVVDLWLSDRPFLGGEGLTLANMAFGPLVHRWFALPLVRPELPALQAYYGRLLDRPAYVARCAVPPS